MDLLKFIEYKDLYNWSVKHLLETQFNYNKDYELVKIGNFLIRNKTKIDIQDDEVYKRVTIKLYNKGVYLRDEKIGNKIGTKKQFIINEGQFLLSKIDARNGAFGVVPNELDNAIITGNFWTYDLDETQIEPYYLALITTTNEFLQFCQNSSSGTTGRHYLKEDKFLDVKIPLPPLSEQQQIIKKIVNIEKTLTELKVDIEKSIQDFSTSIFLADKKSKSNNILDFIEYKDLYNWSVKHLLETQFNYNKDYELVKIGNFLIRNKTKIDIQDDEVYKRVTIKLYNKGVYLRDEKIGNKIGTKKQFIINEGQFLLSKIDARNGAFGVVPNELDNAIITGNFWTYDLDETQIEPYYLALITTTNEFLQFCQNSSSGTTGRHYLKEDKFLDVKIPLPSLKQQRKMIKEIVAMRDNITSLEYKKTTEISNFEKRIFSEA